MSQTERSQAQRVIDRFGGPARLAEAMAAAGFVRHPVSIYKWTYPKERGGTGGVVPTRAWPAIMRAAAAEGIYLSAEDTDPRGR